MSINPTPNIKPVFHAPPSLLVPSLINVQPVHEVVSVLDRVLTDVISFYGKLRNYYARLNGTNFFDYHILFEDLLGQILKMRDALMERVQEIMTVIVATVTLPSERLRPTEIRGSDKSPHDMLLDIREDNCGLLKSIRKAQHVLDNRDDIITSSLLDNLLHETEKQGWFLYETNFVEVSRA